MRKVKTLRVYNLVDSKGNKLRLELGIITEGLRDECPLCSADKGYRWRFIGDHIPMPVRSMYWFNGFEESIMLDWLKANGWYPHTRVEMDGGWAKVYELPKRNELSDDDEQYELSESAMRLGEQSLHDAVNLLCKNGYVLKAVALYRYVHPSSLVEAKHKVDDIRYPK